MPEAGMFKTDDMVLAVVLSLEGYEYTLEKMDHKVIWVFTVPTEREEDFDDVVDDVSSFEWQVEPRKFSSRWAKVRREVYALAPPRQRPDVPATAA